MNTDNSTGVDLMTLMTTYIPSRTLNQSLLRGTYQAFQQKRV